MAVLQDQIDKLRFSTGETEQFLSQDDYTNQIRLATKASSERRWQSLFKEMQELMDSGSINYLNEEQFEQRKGDLRMEYPGDNKITPEELDWHKLEQFHTDTAAAIDQRLGTGSWYKALGGALAGSLTDPLTLGVAAITSAAGLALSAAARTGSVVAANSGRLARARQFLTTPSIGRGVTLGIAGGVAETPADILLEESSGLVDYSNADIAVNVLMNAIFGAGGDALGLIADARRRAGSALDVDADDMEVAGTMAENGHVPDPDVVSSEIDNLDPQNGAEALGPPRSDQGKTDGDGLDAARSKSDADKEGQAPAPEPQKRKFREEAPEEVVVNGRILEYDSTMVTSLAAKLVKIAKYGATGNGAEAIDELIDWVLSNRLHNGSRAEISDLLRRVASDYIEKVRKELGVKQGFKSASVDIPTATKMNETSNSSKVTIGGGEGRKRVSATFDYETPTLKLLHMVARPGLKQSAWALKQLAELTGESPARIKDTAKLLQRQIKNAVQNAEDLKSVKVATEMLEGATELARKRNATVATNPAEVLARVFSDATVDAAPQKGPKVRTQEDFAQEEPSHYVTTEYEEAAAIEEMARQHLDEVELQALNEEADTIATKAKQMVKDCYGV